MEILILMCALADAPLKVPGSAFKLTCSQCGRRVMVAPSGQKFLKAHPLARIECIECVAKKDAGKLDFGGTAATGDELRREIASFVENDWPKRN